LEELSASDGASRRAVLKGAVVAGGLLAWSAPSLSVLSGRALAAGPGSGPPPGGPGAGQQPQPPASSQDQPSSSVLGERFQHTHDAPKALAGTGAAFPVAETVAVAAAATVAGALTTVVASSPQRTPGRHARTRSDAHE
jgi:hypothetical protein